MVDQEHQEWLEEHGGLHKKPKHVDVPAKEEGRPARKNGERDDDDSILNQTDSHPY